MRWCSKLDWGVRNVNVWIWLWQINSQIKVASNPISRLFLTLKPPLIQSPNPENNRAPLTPTIFPLPHLRTIHPSGPNPIDPRLSSFFASASLLCFRQSSAKSPKLIRQIMDGTISLIRLINLPYPYRLCALISLCCRRRRWVECGIARRREREESRLGSVCGVDEVG